MWEGVGGVKAVVATFSENARGNKFVPKMINISRSRQRIMSFLKTLFNSGM